MTEDTLVILKPDTLSRGLVGTVTDRFEKVGLKLVACKMAMATDALLDKMYDTKDKVWVEGMGEKTLSTLKEFGEDPKKHLRTDDAYNVGLEVAKDLKAYMREGPVIVMIWEGFSAVSIARKIRGETRPNFAHAGTILGDLSHDSTYSALLQSRSLRNIAHSSGTVEEANKEIGIWFGKDFRPM